jgi:hypothetical protein
LQVSASQVSALQVSALQVSALQVSALQVSASQVSAFFNCILCCLLYGFNVKFTQRGTSKTMFD